MKKFINIVAVSLIGLFSATSAHAGFYIEPYLGYEKGSIDDGTNEDDTSGTALGARIGWGMLGFAVGADYQKGAYTIDSTPEDDIDTTDLGLFVSYKFPVFVRVFATYFIDSKGELDSSGAEVTGKGLRLGVSFTGLPFVNINLEKISRTYDEFEQGALSGSQDPEIESDGLMLSVSAPFSF